VIRSDAGWLILPLRTPRTTAERALAYARATGWVGGEISKVTTVATSIGGGKNPGLRLDDEVGDEAVGGNDGSDLITMSGIGYRLV
jgi:hypothetical protein